MFATRKYLYIYFFSTIFMIYATMGLKYSSIKTFSPLLDRVFQFLGINNSVSRKLTHKSNKFTSPLNTPNPTVVHRTLHKEDLKSKTIVIGDVHGCLDELHELLAKCSYNEKDHSVIFVGDLVNKGPFSAEVIKFAREINAYSVRGNHDDAALAYILGILGGKSSIPPSYDYISKLTKEDVQWFQDLPYTVSIPSLDALIVHAGLVPGKNLDFQLGVDMYSMRNIITEGNIMTAVAHTKMGEAWANSWVEGPHVYFGHDAKRGLQLGHRATGLDTGCCYGRQLSAIILPSKEIVQVDAKEIYEAPKG